MSGPRLILASASPRRRDLMRQIGLDPIVQASRVGEADAPGPVEERVLVLARRKAEAVAGGAWSAWVVAADTLGAVDGEVLGQPVDADDARRMLRRLSGRVHEVTTGVVALRCEDGRVVDRAEERVTTRVRFVALSSSVIDGYVATGEPLGKAGGYAVQGLAAAFVDHLEGSWSNVVGLPVHAVVRLLHRLDFPLPPHLRLDA